MAALICLSLATILTCSSASEYSQLISHNNSGFRLGPKPGLADQSVVVDDSSEASSMDDGDVYHEVTVGYPAPGRQTSSSYKIPSSSSSYRASREEGSFKSRSSAYRKQRSRKVHPGQYADKRKNPNWKSWPEYTKSSVSPSDTKLAWSYWEEDEHEGWEADDADDSKTTTTTTTTTTTEKPTTTTTTTEAPTTATTKAAKPPVSIHKHFHYFKKDDPWKKGDAMPTTAMPMMEEMMMMKMPPEMMKMPPEEMKMPEEMMMEMMMKGMMMVPPPQHEKGGGKLSGIFDKLAKVDPITVLVAGIVPASLILAAALPSVMKVIMKDDVTTMTPMITTTAVSSGDDAMAAAGRSDDDLTMTKFVEAVGEFGKRALERPHCARQMICRFAKDTIVADSPVVRKAVQFAAVAMEDSWLDHLGVRSILASVDGDTCSQVECEDLD